jgi:hypothetical protein
MSILLASWFNTAAATAASAAAVAAVAKPDEEMVDETAVANFIQLVEKCQDMILNDCTKQEATVLLEELQEQEDQLWNVLDDSVSQQAAIVRTVLESYASSSSSSSSSSLFPHHSTMWTTDICDAWRDLVSSPSLYGSWWHLLWPPSPLHHEQPQSHSLDWNDMESYVSNVFDLVRVLRDHAYPLAPGRTNRRRRWVAATLPPPANEAWKMVYVYVLCHVVATTTTIPSDTIAGAAWKDVDDFVSAVQGRVDQCLWHSRPSRAAVALYLWDWWWRRWRPPLLPQQPNASTDSTPLMPANLTLDRVLDQCMGSIHKYVCRQFLCVRLEEYWFVCVYCVYLF